MSVCVSGNVAQPASRQPRGDPRPFAGEYSPLRWLSAQSQDVAALTWTCAGSYGPRPADTHPFDVCPSAPGRGSIASSCRRIARSARQKLRDGVTGGIGLGYAVFGSRDPVRIVARSREKGD